MVELFRDRARELWRVLERMPEQHMTWKELEERFIQAEKEAPDAYVHLEWGHTESYLMVIKGTDRRLADRLQNLCEIGGRKLSEFEGLLVSPTDREPPVRRWFFVLKDGLGRFAGFRFSYDVGGEMRFYGEIPYLAAASADMCVKAQSLAKSASSDAKSAPAGIAIHLEGSQARAYVQSVDASTNIGDVHEINVFTEIRTTIEREVPQLDREKLLRATEALESSMNSPSFVERYKEWAALAANHVTVLGPFFPWLASLLPGTA
jgi:hypothetical protein